MPPKVSRDGLEILANRLEDRYEVSSGRRLLGSVAQMDAVEMRFRPQYWFCERGVNALSLVLRNSWAQQGIEVPDQLLAQRSFPNPAQAGDHLQDPGDEGRLVAFPAARRGR